MDLQRYLEQNHISKYRLSKDSGETYLRLDCDYCNLQSDINSAEVNGIISSEQAWYLRKKYLKMDRSENT